MFLTIQDFLVTFEERYCPHFLQGQAHILDYDNYPPAGKASRYRWRNNPKITFSKLDCAHTHSTHRPHRSHYAAITLTAPVRPLCIRMNPVCNFSWVLTVAPWWWFPCKPKHVGAAFLFLICFNKLYMCISWTRKCLISLTHGATMKILTTSFIIHFVSFIYIFYILALDWRHFKCLFL